MTLIEARGLSVTIGGEPVLQDVSLRLTKPEIVTLVGPNGSGKSTLLRALLGLVPATGSIARAPGLTIGYVPQRLHIDPAMPMTVDRFLSLPKWQAVAPRRAALDRVGVPDVAQRQLGALSGGQFQRVLLARALLSRPDLLILDEPTQGLDQPGIAGFYKLIEQVRAELGCAILMVSHDLHVVMAASDRVICLNGHICCEGTPEIVSNAPEYRALFGLGTQGTMALYRHLHDHDHNHDHHAQGQGHAQGHAHGHSHDTQNHDHLGHGHPGHSHHGAAPASTPAIRAEAPLETPLERRGADHG